MSEYYVRFRNKVTGPYSLDQLGTMRQLGRLSRMHEVSEDRASWRPALTLEDLFRESRSIAPNPPTAATAPTTQTATLQNNGTVGPAAEWHYARGNDKHGPVSMAELGRLCAAGDLLPTDLVWRQGMSEWMPVRELEKLARATLRTAPKAEVKNSDSPRGADSPWHVSAEWHERRNPLFDPQVWALVFPIRAWWRDRPWSVVWIQRFLFFGLFPLGLAYSFHGEADPLSTAWAYSTYFVLVWGVILRFCLRPQATRDGLLLKVSLFAIIPAIPLAVLADWLATNAPLVRDALSRSVAVPLQLLGWTLGVGVPEEAAKFLPVYLFLRRYVGEFRATTCAFVGCVSGLAFGAAEASQYSLLYAVRQELLSSLGLDFNRAYGDYITTQLLRFITLPLLHAVWTGIVAYFFGLSALSTAAKGTLVVIGLIIASTLHGCYDALSDGWWGFGVAAASLLIFVSYIRMDELIAKNVTTALATAHSTGAVGAESNRTNGSEAKS